MSRRRPFVGAIGRWCLCFGIWRSLVAEGLSVRWLYGLTDPRDPWFSDDKASHWLGAAFAMCKSRELVARWFASGLLTSAVVVWSWIAVVTIILLVEAIEVHRWEQWQARGAPMPWPWLTDRVSLKDIVWGLLGAWMATL